MRKVEPKSPKGNLNMLKNARVILLVLALLAFTAAPAFAQDLPEPFCGSLAAEDCDFLKDAQTAQLEVASQTSVVNLTSTIAGIPGLPADELTFTYGQDATIVVDPALALRMLELQQDPEALADNLDEMMELVVELYRTMEMDLDLSVTLPEEIAALLSAQAGIEIPEDLAVELILKDGFGYVATEGLAFADPSIPELGEWLGIDLAGLIEMSMAQSDEMKSDPQVAQSMAFGAVFSSEEVRSLFDPFIEVERADDSDVDGVEVAVFETSFDFAGFLASPGFWSFVEANLDTINSMGEAQFTAEDLQQAQMALTFLGPALLQGIELTTTSSIGLDDGYLYNNNVYFNWDLSDLLAFAASTGAVPVDGGSDAIITLAIDSSSANFNDAPEVEAPADAVIFPIEELEAQ
jgi:hypothetical protein